MQDLDNVGWSEEEVLKYNVNLWVTKDRYKP